jgi:hypothetical protein
MNRRNLLQLGFSTLAIQTKIAPAEVFPDRPIKIYQGFAPGGGSDSIARNIAAEMSKGLGQPILIEALQGAGGTIAAATVARSKPDGYTLFMASGAHSVAGAMYNSLPYKTVADFEFICNVLYLNFVMVVRSDAKFQNFREVITAASISPESIAFGSAGVGATAHLGGELLAKLANIKLLHIPYRGDTASLAALLAGDVPFIITPPTPAILSNLKAGKLRILASAGSTRWSGLPDIPTVSEQGVSGYDVKSWGGLIAPLGTPRSIIDRLNSECIKALQVKLVRERLEDLGGEIHGSTSEEMKKMVATETQKWIQIVSESKIPKQ